MRLSADRASGAFFLLFGLALYFLIIPVQTEDVPGANLAPDTVPNALAWVIVFFSAITVIKPTDFQIQSPRSFLVTGAYAGVLVVGIYAMSLFGFEWVAPPLALAIMWMIGERRPLWLLAGVILLPLLIWFLVTFPLGRALP
ncbi:MAG: tripartite tricarboxylate transporter TctB family protein [Sulfitobacter sp.]